MKTFKFISILSFCIIFFAGCSSSNSSPETDNNNDDTQTSESPSLPANAVTITTSNATSVATSAASSVDTASLLFAVETGIPSSKLAIDAIVDSVFNRSRTITSTAASVTDACPISGSITDDFVDSATSSTGTSSFNACDLGGITINGVFTYTIESNFADGPFTDSGHGAMSITIGTESFTIDLIYSTDGNTNTGEYSVTMTYSMSESAFGGYLVETTEALTGIYPADATSGQLIVSGANSTRLRLTITSPTTIDVQLDDGNGIFVMHNTISVNT